MKLLAIILLVIAVTQATYSQCSDRVNGLGVNARYFVNQYADAININATYNFKKHSFQAGPFLSLYQLTKIQIFPGATTSDLYSGINWGYQFFANRQSQTFDFFFYYNGQVGPSPTEFFKGFYTLHQTAGYGFNIYLGKKKKLYLTHLLGAGIAFNRNYRSYWYSNEKLLVIRKDFTPLVALGIGFNSLQLRGIKEEQKQQ